jgi:Domain of unknown function (DUF4265)
VTPERTTVDLVAGEKSSGERVYERVLVDVVGDDEYRIVASPALVLGVASGDLIRVDDGRFEVLSRGPNLVIQVYGPHDLVDEAVTDVWRLGGALDGHAKRVTAFTIPVKVGFSAVEAVFNALVGRHPELEWYFGNVYDTDGVTPLGWWE